MMWWNNRSFLMLMMALVLLVPSCFSLDTTPPGPDTSGLSLGGYYYGPGLPGSSPGGTENPPPATTPMSPEDLGIQPPAAASVPFEGPSDGGEALMMVDESAALMSAPSSPSSPVAYKMIMPSDGTSENRFYVPYAYSTVAGCNLYSSLPLWLDISGSGGIWGYEWYPDGHLDVQPLGYAFPGWYERGFFADTPGWHILQYYCGGWSNYIYIYVYGYGPYPPPTPSIPGPGMARVIITSDWMIGYDVYVDGDYVGGDGRGSDPRDGDITFYVQGNRYHFIRVNYRGTTYSEQGTFLTGYTYRLSI